MMNTETKRHIDAARQVLVGVVPNPTAQIDQITNALIYKFMDDMDQAAIKAGSNPSFFVDDLKPYAWTRLMDTRMGNQERMDLYADALTKFSEAKQLPELFRNIFKSAFLPYRAPETLGLFLKEIAHFDYSHSEELGNAYEYLLSIMSSQGDAGQFRTPRHIIDFIVDVVNPTKDDKILDPACGTGGFLVSSYKHILEQHDGNDASEKKERSLTPDERKKLMNNFEGYDIDPTMVRIAQVNTYLHQFKNPKIYNYDTLSSDERWNDKFDVILANPPFMSPKGGIKPHSKFSIQSSRSEVLFVDYIMNHLRPNGRAGIIVPEGIIFQSGSAYKQLRKNLVENGLYAVVSLPPGVFQPYSGVKTSILLFDNERAKQSSEILFVKVESDGFDLGAQRKPINKNDLPQALEILNKWNAGEKVDNNLTMYVEKSKIAESGDYNLSGNRYRVAIDYTNAKWPIVKIGEVAHLMTGGTPLTSKKEFYGGNIKWLVSGDIHKGEIFDCDGRITELALKESNARLLPINSVLIALNGQGKTRGTVAILRVEATCNQSLVSIKPNTQKLIPEFLLYVLKGKYQEIRNINGDNQRGGLNMPIIRAIEIPLPPLEIQEQIVAELNEYNGIIAGARKVAENWKPKIDIDPKWEKVKLGDVCERLTDGSHNPPKAKVGGGYFMLSAQNIFDGHITITKAREISEEDFNNENRRTKINNGDVLLTIVGTIGRSTVVTNDLPFRFTLQRSVAVIKAEKSRLMPEYLSFVLRSENMQNNLIGRSAGVAQKGIYLNQLAEIEIPLPPLDIQKQIVEKIEAERALVESTKKLIAIYEQKTKEAVAKLWNE